MALIDCPECRHRVSDAAAACPQCGHPVRPAPKCYACPAPSTTRCRCCGAFSCPSHLRSIYVTHGRGGAYELRCDACYASAETRKVVGWVVLGVVLLVVLLFFLRHQAEFDRRWEGVPAPPLKKW